MIKDIILASKSIARKKILEDNNMNIVKIIPAEINEIIKYPNNLELSIEEIARNKLDKVKIDNLNTYPILACDTLVSLNNKVYGKPKNKKEAKLMLENFSNTTHKIISGYAIYLPSKEITISGYDVATVSFGELSNQIIDNYLNFNDYQNCAGGYRIQNLPKEFKMQYFGDYYTIMGLPFSKIFDILNMLSV